MDINDWLHYSSPRIYLKFWKRTKGVLYFIIVDSNNSKQAHEHQHEHDSKYAAKKLTQHGYRRQWKRQNTTLMNTGT